MPWNIGEHIKNCITPNRRKLENYFTCVGITTHINHKIIKIYDIYCSKYLCAPLRLSAMLRWSQICFKMLEQAKTKRESRLKPVYDIWDTGVEARRKGPELLVPYIGFPFRLIMMAWVELNFGYTCLWKYVF